MFRVNPGFVAGYNYVKISDVTMQNVKGNLALSIVMTNEYAVSQRFLVFLNNTYLVHQLLSAAFESYSIEEDLDEKDLIGLEVYIYLVPKDTYFIITKFEECEQDDVS